MRKKLCAIIEADRLVSGYMRYSKGTRGRHFPLEHEKVREENNMEQRFCQSCSMPMGNTDEFYGTEKDGSKSGDYCKYCYENGAFTFDGTMEEMIEMCVEPTVQTNPGMTAEAARGMLQQYIPMMKRWSKH